MSRGIEDILSSLDPHDALVLRDRMAALSHQAGAAQARTLLVTADARRTEEALRLRISGLEAERDRLAAGLDGAGQRIAELEIEIARLAEQPAEVPAAAPEPEPPAPAPRPQWKRLLRS